MRYAVSAAATLFLAGATALAVLPASGPAVAQAVATGPSGLPLPRFVSLSSDKVNVRRGPGVNFDVAWVFVRAGVPVEIIQEFENWRKIRDWEGSEGWIHRSLLSGRRTVIVAPWDDRAQFALRRSPSEGAGISAYLEANLFAAVVSCADNWCRLEDERFNGWIEQNRLWGVYPQEVINE
ncbi:MAG TPA: SH3 domain-containing protein [Afifellaceae bacterium]|nr:SH3 domain-containing protein [Afifellaceae bacterium]